VVLKQFDRNLSLWDVSEEEALKPERLNGDLGQDTLRLSISTPGTPIAPTRANLNKALGNRLLMFAFSPDCPVAYRRFLHRNFGTFDQWIDGRGAKLDPNWLQKKPIASL
jgi:hypothetical protein